MDVILNKGSNMIFSISVLTIFLSLIFFPFVFATKENQKIEERDKKALEDSKTGTHFLKR